MIELKDFQGLSEEAQEAVADMLRRMRYERLARECAKLDPEVEEAMAEEGFGS
jgi:hypothetical protein